MNIEDENTTFGPNHGFTESELCELLHRTAIITRTYQGYIRLKVIVCPTSATNLYINHHKTVAVTTHQFASRFDSNGSYASGQEGHIITNIYMTAFMPWKSRPFKISALFLAGPRMMSIEPHITLLEKHYMKRQPFKGFPNSIQKKYRDDNDY
jgi:hypothetical protein